MVSHVKYVQTVRHKSHAINSFLVHDKIMITLDFIEMGKKRKRVARKKLKLNWGLTLML